MRLTQIRDFLAVVECGGIRAAARKLGVSQPTITKSVRSLQAELHAAPPDAVGAMPREIIPVSVNHRYFHENSWRRFWSAGERAGIGRKRYDEGQNRGEERLSERPRGDFEHALRDAFRVADALERGARVRLASGVELPPVSAGRPMLADGDRAARHLALTFASRDIP